VEKGLSSPFFFFFPTLISLAERDVLCFPRELISPVFGFEVLDSKLDFPEVSIGDCNRLLVPEK